MRPHGMVFEVVDAEALRGDRAGARADRADPGGRPVLPARRARRLPQVHDRPAPTASRSSASAATSAPRSERCARRRPAGVDRDQQGPDERRLLRRGDGQLHALHLRPLGVRLDIYPAKGVTVTVPAAPWQDGPKVPIIDDTRLFGLIRLGDRYRCSGLGRVHGLRRHAEPCALPGDRRQRRSASFPSWPSATTPARRNSGRGSGRWRRRATPISARRRSGTCS